VRFRRICDYKFAVYGFFEEHNGIKPEKTRDFWPNSVIRHGHDFQPRPEPLLRRNHAQVRFIGDRYSSFRTSVLSSEQRVSQFPISQPYTVYPKNLVAFDF
jgi:hypothetical protein